jgi:hypothetical protein
MGCVPPGAPSSCPAPRPSPRSRAFRRPSRRPTFWSPAKALKASGAYLSATVTFLGNGHTINEVDMLQQAADYFRDPSRDVHHGSQLDQRL